MLHLAASTSAASSPDWVARGIGLASLVLSGVGMLLTRHLWRRAGAALAFDLFIEAFRIPDSDVVHRMRIKIEVANVGRMAATVRQIDLRSPWPPFTREVSVMGDPLPQVLQPTAFLESESIDLIAPDEAVVAALTPAVPEDMIASEIIRALQVRAENRVRGQVRRGDNEEFRRPRRTVIEYRDASWQPSRSITGGVEAE